MFLCGAESKAYTALRLRAFFLLQCYTYRALLFQKERLIALNKRVKYVRVNRVVFGQGLRQLLQWSFSLPTVYAAAYPT